MCLDLKLPVLHHYIQRTDGVSVNRILLASHHMEAINTCIPTPELVLYMQYCLVVCVLLSEIIDIISLGYIQSVTLLFVTRYMNSIRVNGVPQRKVLLGTIYGISYWCVLGHICDSGQCHE